MFPVWLWIWKFMDSMAAHAMGFFNFLLHFVQMELKSSISPCLNSRTSEINFKIKFCYFHSLLEEFQLPGIWLILRCNKNRKKQIEITDAPGSRDLSLSYSGYPLLGVLSCESVCLHSLSSTTDLYLLPFYAKENEFKKRKWCHRCCL